MSFLELLKVLIFLIAKYVDPIRNAMLYHFFVSISACFLLILQRVKFYFLERGSGVVKILWYDAFLIWLGKLIGLPLHRFIALLIGLISMRTFLALKLLEVGIVLETEALVILSTVISFI